MPTQHWSSRREGPSGHYSVIMLCLLILGAHGAATTATKFAIVSVVSGPVPAPHYAQAITNRALYSTRHNYVFRLYSHIDESRPAAWSKVLAVKQTILLGLYDWVMVMDADALVTNLATTLDHLVPADDQIDIVLAKDCEWLGDCPGILVHVRFLEKRPQGCIAEFCVPPCRPWPKHGQRFDSRLGVRLGPAGRHLQWCERSALKRPAPCMRVQLLYMQ